jgi:excisionase family DNA binding protein
MTSRGTEKLLLSVPEAAEALGVSRSHLYNLIQSGKLPVIRLGASVRVPRRWLEEFVEQQVKAWESSRNGWG